MLQNFNHPLVEGSSMKKKLEQTNGEFSSAICEYMANTSELHQARQKHLCSPPFFTIRPPKTCFLIQPNKMILSPMLDGLISPITAGHLEKICKKALLSFSGVCVFPSHLLVNFQESAIKVIGWEVTVS